MVQLVVPRQPEPVSVNQLLARERQQPRTPALTCNEHGCPAVGQLVPSTLVTTPGQVLLVHLLRNVGGVGVDANGVDGSKNVRGCLFCGRIYPRFGG